MSRRLRLSLLAFAAASVCAGAASAQTYSRAVVFGDSLSDNGNLYNATAKTTPPSPPYFQGRYSNGPVWVELLFPNLRQVGTVTGNTDYAYGGARTDNQANPPSLPNQLALFRSQGGTFSSSDVVTVLGGANNILQGIPAAAASPATAQVTIGGIATAAATDIGNLVRSIAGLGAGTVLVSNLPNIGATPSLNTSPAAALGTFASDTFNSALLTQLQGAAAANPTRNIILMDLARAEAYVRANASRFGFTNVTQSCLNTTTGAACSTPDSHFYWDTVHPTAAGHRLVAAIATDYLYYGRLAAPTATQAETTLEHRRRSTESAFDRLWTAAPGDERSTRANLSVEYGRADSDARGDVPDANADTAALRFAADGVMSSGRRAGVQIAYSRSNVDAGPLTYDVVGFSGDIYAGWRGERWFVDLVAGGGLDEYRDIQRQTSLAGVRHTGHTDGYNFGAAARVGMLYRTGSGVLSPRIGLDAVTASVDGYKEEGPLARQDLAERQVDAVAAQVSVRYDTRVTDTVDFYGEVGYRGYLAYSGDDVAAGLVENPAQRLRTSVDEPDGNTGIVNAGLSGRINDSWSVGASYRGRFGSDYTSSTGMLTVGMRF